MEQRAKALQQEVDELTARAELVRRRLVLLEELNGVSESHFDSDSEPADAVPSALPLGELAGADVRRVAVRLLLSSDTVLRPIHYRRWYEYLRDSGYGVRGRDPLATFLTQLNRSPVVRRAEQPGFYLVDLDAPARLHKRMGELHDELLALHAGQQTIEEIGSVRERRTELTRELAGVERDLEEALQVLGPERGEQ